MAHRAPKSINFLSYHLHQPDQQIVGLQQSRFSTKTQKYHKNVTVFSFVWSLVVDFKCSWKRTKRTLHGNFKKSVISIFYINVTLSVCTAPPFFADPGKARGCSLQSALSLGAQLLPTALRSSRLFLWNRMDIFIRRPYSKNNIYFFGGIGNSFFG